MRPPPLAAHLSLLLGGQAVGAPRIALLQAIAATGSITQAAKALGISYKAAWDAVDQMNQLAGMALTARATGGRGGGASALTPAGEALVDRFARLDALHRRFVAQLSAAEDADLRDAGGLVMSMLKLSVRNQFLGEVRRVVRGAVHDEVELQLPGGQGIVAHLTHESTESLGLASGIAAVALVPAQAVMLATGSGDLRLSARNQFAGHVDRITPGAVNAEVVLTLPGGTGLAAMVTRDSLDALGLAPGVACTALFKAGSVIVGVAP